MRQRLLENVTLRLEEVFNQALTLEAAARNAESYRTTSQSSAVSFAGQTRGITARLRRYFD